MSDLCRLLLYHLSFIHLLFILINKQLSIFWFHTFTLHDRVTHKDTESVLHKVCIDTIFCVTKVTFHLLALEGLKRHSRLSWLMILIPLLAFRKTWVCTNYKKKILYMKNRSILLLAFQDKVKNIFINFDSRSYSYNPFILEVK